MTASAYTWDNAMIEGRRRLALLEGSLDPATYRRLESIGIGEGWRCLDLGAGGGTVCEWLSIAVGSRGTVVGVDLDARFLRALALPNLEVREENIVDTTLADGSFDLVHTRWTLLHIPERDVVLAKLIALLKPGGILFLEEPDIYSVRATDPTSFRDLCERAAAVILPRGSHCEWARELPYKVAAAGLGNLRAEVEAYYFHGGSSLAEFWKTSWGRVRDAVAAAGADVSQWNRELAELDDPTKLFVGPATIAVIATK